MNVYPIGNNLTVKWTLRYSDGTVFPLSLYDYDLSYRTSRGVKVATDTTVEDNVLRWMLKADDQVVSGPYSLALKISFAGNKAVDLQYNNVFALTSLSHGNGANVEVCIESNCDVIDLKDAVLQARKAMDIAANSARDAKSAEATAAQAKVDAESAKTMAADAKDKIAIAEKAATDASRDAVASQQAAQTASDHITSLQQAIAELPDGQAVTEKVAEHTIKLSDLGSKIGQYKLSFTPNTGVNMNVGVGNVVDGVQPNNEGYNSILVECKEGDVFIVTGFAGYLRLWGFLDENMVLLSVAETMTTETEAIHIAPLGAKYFASNSKDGEVIAEKYDSINNRINFTNDEIYKTQDDINSIKEVLDIKTESLSIVSIEGKYITTDGNVADVSFASITEPIKVNVGDWIKVVCSAVSTISVITKCDENGNNRIPLVLGSGDYQSTKSYSLKVDFDGYVIFSFRTDKGIEALRYYSSNQFNIEDYEWCKYVFSKGICIGDSLTDGIVYDAPRTNEGGQQFRQYAYPAQLEKMTGWTLTNAGFGGISTSDWWKNKFANYNYQEYEMAIIELGINGGLTDTLAADVEPYDNYMDYADTHTGNYCKIIEGMRASNPNIIIVLTIGNRMINSNAILATVVEKIALKYDLPIIDLRKTDEYDLNDNRYHGYNYLTDSGLNMLHFNFVGYLAKANLIYKQLIKIIYDRIKEVNDKVFS